MKTQFIITAIFASSMIFGSCTDDLIVEPNAGQQETVTTYEEEYQLTIRVETDITASEFNDAPGRGHILSLTGKGIAFSTTFGPMNVETDLEYEVETGRVSGFVSMIVRNTNEELQIRIEEKNVARDWSGLMGACFSTSSFKPFAGKNFTGEMCIKHIASGLRELDIDNTAVFSIQGSLK